MAQSVLAYLLVAAAGAWMIRGLALRHAPKLKPVRIRKQPAQTCGSCDCGH